MTTTTATPGSDVGRFGSGHAVRRIEDPALVTGTGLFVDDVTLPQTLHLALLRSPHPHARIRSIDVEAARALPGVLAIYTGADLQAAGVRPLPTVTAFRRPDGSAAATPPRQVMAVDTVRFVGEAVAAVVAETRDAAREARDAIFVDFEDLPAAATLEVALADGAPRVWPQAEGNLCAVARHGDTAACDAAFAAAAHVIALDLVNQRLSAVTMEPRGVLAHVDADSGRLTVRLSSQMPSGARDTLCDAVLGIPRDQVRVVVGDVGGGFGMKTGLYPEDAIVAWCALQLRRPVKWIAERSEEFLAAATGRATRSRAELALDAQGRALALRVHTDAEVGAYGTSSGVSIPLLVGPWVATSIYDIPTIDFDLRAILTNTAPVGAYRGAGRPEAIYVIERLMDAAARKLGLDPAELRLRNMIGPERMPYTNPMKQTYDVGNFPSIAQQGLALADWSGFEARAADARRRGRLRGRGLATFLEWTGGNVFTERVQVRVTAEGIEIWAATQAMGQGLATTYAQLAVDVFGVPIDRVRIVFGDTDRGSGFGSGGSRSLFTAGSAVRVASQRTVDEATALAADALEVAPRDIAYRDASFSIVGTDRRIGLFELAARQPGGQVFVDSTSSVEGPTWPNGCHVCEVEVDAESGVVEVVAYTSVNDVGRVVNPMIVRGQLDGGAVQGLGQALCEGVVYDRDSGQLLTGTLSDYALPRADLVHAFRTELDTSIPSVNNPLGVKGVGELGTIGATPAAVTAVIDALVRAGVPAARAEAMQMPLTPETVWRALQGD